MLLRFTDQALEFIGRLCQMICSVIALLMVVLITVQVILRGLNMPLFGIEEFLSFTTIWIYFIGGACAAYTDSHIECGIIKAVSKSKRRILVAEVVGNLIACGLALYVLKWGADFSAYSLKINKVSAVLGIPMPLGELSIMLGLSLMALYTTAKLLKTLFSLKERWQEGGNS